MLDKMLMEKGMASDKPLPFLSMGTSASQCFFDLQYIAEL